MRMLLSIAWRNVWRNRGRSLVVMGSIVLGVWALIFANGFMNGFMVGYMANTIENEISSVQIHHNQFKQDFSPKFYIRNGVGKAETIRSWEGVRGVTTRAIVNGMISSPKSAKAVMFRGVDLDNESKVTNLDSMLVEGTYFEGIKRNPIIIGEQLAEDLKVKLRSKVVVTFTNAAGEITAASFRVVGIVKSASLNINGFYAFIKNEDMWKVMNIGNEVHEIAVLTDAQFDENIIVSTYKEIYPDDLTETWREVSPELSFLQDMYGSTLYVLVVIIMLGLVFGIINTMLMAVLERIKELGMLMAIGMTKFRIYLMVLIETLFLGIAGSPIGLLIGFFTIQYFRNTGVDLSNWSEGLEAFGYSSMLYPYIETSSYIIVTISVFITAFVAAMYPAWKAIKLNPAEALHKI